MRRVLSLSYATVRRYTTTAPKLLTAAEVKGWDMARVQEYAEGELKLGAKAVEVLKTNDIDGETLLGLTEAKLLRTNMPLGPATKLAAAIAELRGTREYLAGTLRGFRFSRRFSAYFPTHYYPPLAPRMSQGRSSCSSSAARTATVTWCRARSR